MNSEFKVPVKIGTSRTNNLKIGKTEYYKRIKRMKVSNIFGIKRKEKVASHYIIHTHKDTYTI